MKQEMNVKAHLNEPGVLVTIVETLASQHVDKGYSKMRVPRQWSAVETSSIQAFVLGNFNVTKDTEETEETITIPFSGSFLFTCFKEKNGLFNLVWSASLS